MILDKFVDNKPIHEIAKYSDAIVNVKCDVCGNEKTTKFSAYNRNIRNGGFYACCSKCAVIKKENTNMLKYGVKNASESSYIKEKIKNTFVEKYGIQNPGQLDSVKNKIKETCLEKYGVENPFQNEEIKEKSKETLFEKYGVYHNMKLKETKEKIEETCLKKYGCKNPFQSDKSKQTCLEKYGVEYYAQSKDWYNKVHDNIDKNDWLKYKTNVRKQTKKNKKELFEKWNGYDFYDGEYIKDNFNKNYNDISYPSIDHKISIYYGFINNIPECEISDINNLCITKRTINSSKNKNNEYAIS